MEEILQKSVFSGIVFSTFQDLGPQPIYMYSKRARLSILEYTQISIKSLSLLIDDKIIMEKERFVNMSHFAILPFPDLKLMALSFFHFIEKIENKTLIPSSLTLFIDEKNRNFLYNNINRIKPIILTFINNLDAQLSTGIKTEEEIKIHFEAFFNSLLEMEKKPIMKIIEPRKLKILFAGLDNSGKTSFLLALDRKFSKLIGLKPTRGASISTLETFGRTIIFLWDLAGQSSSREGYLNKPQVYLYETDLLFYFIDIQDRKRIIESINYLNEILNKISEEFIQKPPIIYILSKGDSDILNLHNINENIRLIKEKLIKTIGLKEEPVFYVTSIFSIFTILRAFSSGISKLSPNREVIQEHLKQISTKSKVFISMLLNNDGLVLADYYYSKLQNLFKKFKNENKTLDQEFKDVLEFTAPEFAFIWKIFSKFKTLKKDDAVFKIADFIIYIRGIQIADSPMFLMCLLDDEDNIQKIKENLPQFLDKTTNLLIKYMN